MNNTKKLTLAGMCLALGVIVPQAFHAIPNAGLIFLPMHIPVLICGFICGPLYGLLNGILTPVISHILFSMPSTVMLGQMIIELGVYGLMTGSLNKFITIKNNFLKTYVVLIASMLLGRIIYGLANTLIFKVENYSLGIWLSIAFVTAIPGIIIQLIIVPIIVSTLSKTLN